MLCFVLWEIYNFGRPHQNVCNFVLKLNCYFVCLSVDFAQLPDNIVVVYMGGASCVLVVDYVVVYMGSESCVLVVVYVVVYMGGESCVLVVVYVVYMGGESCVLIGNTTF